MENETPPQVTDDIEPDDLERREYEAFRDPGTPLAPGQLQHRKAVLAAVTDNPESFDMTQWFARKGCTTTRCVAGWSQFLAAGRVNLATVSVDAIRNMGLTEAEFFSVRNGLFYCDEDQALAALKRLAAAPC